MKKITVIQYSLGKTNVLKQLHNNYTITAITQLHSKFIDKGNHLVSQWQDSAHLLGTLSCNT